MNDTNDIFERATNLHLRYTTSRGDATTEDLWDMPLSSSDGFNLDILALALDNEINSTAQKSFVRLHGDPNDIINKLKFDIVKHIIDFKIERNNKAELRKIRKSKRLQIANIIADKKDDKLKNTSLTKLEAMLNDLTEDEDLEK